MSHPMLHTSRKVAQRFAIGPVVIEREQSRSAQRAQKRAARRGEYYNGSGNLENYTLTPPEHGFGSDLREFYHAGIAHYTAALPPLESGTLQPTASCERAQCHIDGTSHGIRLRAEKRALPLLRSGHFVHAQGWCGTVPLGLFRNTRAITLFAKGCSNKQHDETLSGQALAGGRLYIYDTASSSREDVRSVLGHEAAHTLLCESVRGKIHRALIQGLVMLAAHLDDATASLENMTGYSFFKTHWEEVLPEVLGCYLVDPTGVQERLPHLTQLAEGACRGMFDAIARRPLWQDVQLNLP